MQMNKQSTRFDPSQNCRYKILYKKQFDVTLNIYLFIQHSKSVLFEVITTIKLEKTAFLFKMKLLIVQN